MGIDKQRTPVFLTNEEADLFLRFMQYQDKWKRLFQKKAGSLTIHKNTEGELKEWHFLEKEK